MVEVVVPDIETASSVLDIIAYTSNSQLAPKELIDEVEARIMKLQGAEFQGRCEQISFFPLTHRFTPGMYIREIFMPAGAVLTSQIHKTEHPFVISKGHCLVYLNREDGWKEFKAPHTGITYPGTRRILVILEDTIWTTFHVTELTDLMEIERHLSEDYVNPLLSEGTYKPVYELTAMIKEDKE